MKHKPILVAMVTVLLTSQAGLLRSQQITDDLLAHWRFDEGSGFITSDSTGDNDGVLNGDATIVPTGVSGNAVSMTRAGNGFVNMGDIFPMTSGDFSIVFWIKTNPGDQQTDLFVVGKHDAGWTNGYLFGMNTSSAFGQTDKVYFYASAGVGSEAISTTSVNDGTWHQIAGVYRGTGEAEIFVDGGPAEASRVVPVVIGNTAPFMAGGIQWAGNPKGMFDGQIDELMVFGRALITSDIQFLFENPGYPLAIFADGFESGDTSAWSNSVP